MWATTGVHQHIMATCGCFEVQHVSECGGYRIGRNGAHQMLTIRLFDRGSDAEHPRFHAEVESDHDLRITGRAGRSVEGALGSVFCAELDSE